MIKPLLAAAFALPFLVSAGIAQTSDSERLERLERAVQLLQQRNTELEREVSTLKAKKTATATATTAPASPPASPAAASDAKGVVESKPAKEEKKTAPVFAAASELKLTLGGFIQTQFEAGDVFAFEGRFGSGADEIKDRFRIRRARIGVSGDYAEQFEFKLEGEFALTDIGLTIRDPSGATLGSNSTRTSFGATDLFVNWRAIPEFNVKVGQYKAPFGLEQITSDTKLFTNERSLVTTALTAERQIGVQIWGKPFTSFWPEQKDLLTYYAGVFNGTGRNITVNDNNEFMYVGRLEVQALRTKILNEDATLRVGVNGLSSRDESGTTISGALREASDGSLASFSLPSAGERTAYGVDAAFRLGPFDLLGEYINQRVDTRVVNNIAPRFAPFRADGYYIQGSYFVLPKKLQLVTKWEGFDPDQLADDDIYSITAGVNYYLKGDDIKLLANYIHTWSDFRERNPRFGKDQFDEVIVRLQVMF
ncbi:MAG TPA: porin [Chthoniobacterales bacterium]|nr:porin [Chthoniobacterales bacterium]